MSDSIIKKIKALIDKAQSTDSMQEAESFMVKAQELLQKYNLDMSSVREFQSEGKLVEDMTPFNERWEAILANCIAKNNFCKMWTANMQYIVVLGKKDNVDIVTYLLNFFRSSILRLSISSYNDMLEEKRKILGISEREMRQQLSKSTFKNKYLDDFVLGAVYGVNAKMEEQKREAMKANSSLTSLVLTGESEIQKYMEDKKIKLTSKKGKKVNEDSNGFKDGFEKGKSLNANSGISAGSKGMLR